MKKNLLIVDDSAFLQALLRDRLEVEGFLVSQAFDGLQALNMVKDRRYDLVLLDVKMPGLNGFEVCRRIKADPATKDTPVMFLTVMAQKADVEEGLASGAQAYFTKPYESEDLISEIKKLVP